MKYIRVIIMGLVLGAALTAGVYLYKSQMKTTTVTDFESCKAAGYPIGESYPEQCFAPDQTFTGPETAPAPTN